MDIIKESFEEHKGVLTADLEAAGLSLKQARQFLPVVESSLSESTKDAGVVHLVTGLASNGPSHLSDAINADDVAARLNMAPELVNSGLDAIIPILFRVISDKGDGILGAITSLAGGNVDDLIGLSKKKLKKIA